VDARTETEPTAPPPAALGRVGLWAPLWLWVQEGDALPAAAAEIEQLGYGTIWLANGDRVLELAGAALAATRTVTVATGIVNIWVHPAETVAAAHATLAATHPGRWLLGLGNGPRSAEQWQLSPYRVMVDYFDALDARGVPADQRLLAAVGPRMLALAAARSRGAHPFLTTPEHTAAARAELGPRALLAPEQKVVLETDPQRARAVARQALEFYLPKRGYSTNLRRLGFTADDLAGGGSDRLVDAVVARGDADAIRARVQEHLAAGADHVAVQPLTAGTDAPELDRRRLPRDVYRELAPALTT
jgi:probable F420-dependent oxidoreductase